MEALLEQLLDAPDAWLQLERAQEALRREREKRMEFYEKVTEDDKAEFINGEAVYHSPVRLAHHDASFFLAYLLHTHVSQHGLGRTGHEKLMISLSRNDYEPDVCFFRQEVAAGFTPDQLHFPAPDFIAEVLSESTEKNDRGVKFVDYAAHGVREYWIIDPEARVIEQYELRQGRYDLKTKADSGTIQSIAVPGFEIPVRAVFDSAENLAALKGMRESHLS